MEEDSIERRPKRQKRESSYKAKAFEKFKQLKSGTRNKYEPEELENVYDVLDEREYTKKVLARQDDDWIVDDDGSGYVEDGRDIFDDDLDRESIAAASANGSKGTKRRKKGVSGNAGKGNLQYLMSNMPSKKKEEGRIDNDETLSELLKEIDAPCINKSINVASTSASFSPISVKRKEQEYMRNLASQIKKPQPITIVKPPVANVNPPRALQEIQNEIAVPNEVEPLLEKLSSQTDSPQNNDSSQNNSELIAETQHTESMEWENCFNDDLDMSQIEEPEAPLEKEDINQEDIAAEMAKEWETQTEVNETENCGELKNSDIPFTEVADKKAFRFFWWDAFEDASKQPGVVFLFGKTYHENNKSYISCCVAVRNIDRRIFFLPRTMDRDTGNPVTQQDVFNEINESVIKNMQIKVFKSRPIVKKYAFNPEVPAESDYVEVRYSAKDPQVSKSAQGKTFSKIFGTETSYLEILLLDRKIKGPCWLDIASPTLASNPVTWCKLEVNCDKVTSISIAAEVQARPPLVVASINMRRAINPKSSTNEIVMLSCVINNSYFVDKQAPSVPFQKHFCVFTCPEHQILPMDLHPALKNYKATTLQKLDSEKALLNFFISQFAKLDCDLVVGHDLHGHQMNVLSERLVKHQVSSFSKLGRIKRSVLMKQKLERELFVGRLVCDIKISAKELIRCRSYDLESLCQAVLKLKDGQRIDLEPEEVQKLFQTSSDILKLVSMTMQDTSYILRIMYNLNIVPLALQITNIAGNVMSKTLLGGRSERNEFLLLHAFTEKGYIVPDKFYGKKDNPIEKKSKSSRKKPTYSGGLVLDPKVGFYDKMILLMDFNSLYPSIIQEFNICFTTMPPELSEDNMVLPDQDLPPGILPTEIRKLVDSRRDVKKLMSNADISSDLRMQYNIRQMALKLTANSMYGCLGFSNSRFFAKNLAALITYKGREILTTTRDLVQRMNYDVIYGDTDSLMINTNIVDYDQVFQIGSKIKQEINKLYRQVELDIDGVFKYLLLLKKKKYAAVTLSKSKNGELRTEVEYKGLDIVRRDWSRLACEAGKFILNQILCDQAAEDRVSNILGHLRKLREDLESAKVPLSLLVITKQLTKDLKLYTDTKTLPHVQVAQRYNTDFGGHYRSGDTVPYLICDDGTDKAATQRAYHIEELKNSDTRKIDVKYYLSQQIHPVINRILEPMEELDPYQVAECLGIDSSNLKRNKRSEITVGEDISNPGFKFRNVDKFIFKCYSCNAENSVEGPFSNNFPVLGKCCNGDCKVRPVEYVGYIQNQMIHSINSYVNVYYLYEMYCEDPMCSNETTTMPMHFAGRFPLCNLCNNAVLMKKFTEVNLYSQIHYFQYIFDLSKVPKKPLLEYQIEKAYHDIRETVEKRLETCAYLVIDLEKLYSLFLDELRGAKEEDEQDNFITEDDFDEDDE